MHCHSAPKYELAHTRRNLRETSSSTENGETLNEPGRQPAIIRDLDHICAPARRARFQLRAAYQLTPVMIVGSRWPKGLTLATFRRKIDVFGSTSMGFGRAKTAGPPAVIFEGLWM